MTDTSGPRPDEPREPLPSSSSEDLTRPIPRTEGSAPSEPPAPAGFESGPASPPHQPRFPVHPGHRPQLAWVIGGVVVAALTLGTGFVGGFVVGHVVGSHGDDQRFEQMAGPGMNDRGLGNRFHERRGDGDSKKWRGMVPDNRENPNLPDPTDVPTPSDTSFTN